MPTTLELTIRRLLDGTLSADARLTSAASAAPATLAANVPVTLDAAALLAESGDPTAYGARLSTQLFANIHLRDAWLKARAYAATDTLQLRLTLDASDTALHDVRWECLRDPETDQPIALYERVRLVRSLDSADLTPVVIPPRPELRALVVVSNPANLEDFGLAEVDVDGEVSRARAALGDIPMTILGDSPDRRPSLANIKVALRDGPHIVILVAHGTIREGTPVVWLEQADGTADIVTGDAFVEAIRRLAARPLLLVLASCRSAGGGYSYSDTLRALGPQLAGIGVPAVLAFQGDVAMRTVRTLLPTLITELRRDGQIDRALAAARAALGERQPWWQAVLWLRTDGRLWREEEEVPTPTTTGGIVIGGNVGTMQVVNVTGGNVGSIIGSQTNYGAAPPAAASGRTEAVTTQRQRLAQHRETLAHYLNQLAMTGAAHARPEVTAGIREARASIARAQAALAALGEPAEALPDDTL